MKKQILKKQQLVEELASKLKEAKTIVAFEYPGLTVAQLTKLRRALRAENSEMTIYKNNISRRAAVSCGLNELEPTLVGPLALASSNTDIVAPAKVVVEFFKELKDKSKNYKKLIKSGVIEGKVVGVEKIEELAQLPNKDTLLTMLAAGLLQPVQQVALGLHMLTEQKEQE